MWLLKYLHKQNTPRGWVANGYVILKLKVDTKILGFECSNIEMYLCIKGTFSPTKLWLHDLYL